MTNTSPIDTADRFPFGRNWQAFVDGHLTIERMQAAQQRLLSFLKRADLKGMTFLDIGCGSGLHSLAAWQSGAERVVSFDYDQASVSATETIRARAGSPPNWSVQQGSVLDAEFLATLPRADIVYSWGVLHHTGSMWQGIKNAATLLDDRGVFYIALYTSDLYIDRTPEYWLDIKRRYNLASAWHRFGFELWYALRFDAVPRLIRLRNPLQKWLDYRRQARGMSYWIDIRDWLGGWPMEFAGIRETLLFCRDQLGLEVLNLSTGEACSEYLFRRRGASNDWDDLIVNRREQDLPRPFLRDAGPCYVARLPSGHGESAVDGPAATADWTLLEDGEPLGLGHCLPEHVRRAGHGRYGEASGQFYFSASDNSDPNENGRRYTRCRL
jgi:SAM-dependent methyltransferase